MKRLSPAALWVLIVAAPVPFFFFLFHFFFGLQRLEELEGEIERVQAKAAQIEQTRRAENSVAALLKNPDPHYLDTHIETLTFLLPEIKKLEAMQLDNFDEERIAKRLHFLKQGGNRLTFSEEHIRTHELFRETEEKQQNPVELNEEDLKKLLCLIEGITIWPYGPKEGRPQLIVKEFSLAKKELPSKEKVFVVSMQLIKRENP